MGSGLEQTLLDGKLLRQVNSLIVAHLHDQNLNQVANAVASATMTPLTVEHPPNKLLDLVSKGLAMERDEASKGIAPTPLYDSSMAIPAGYGSIPAPRSHAVDFSIVQDTKGSSKSFPKHETRHVSEHKNVARCARFSPDGRFVATGSTDTSIKLFEISKVKQMMLPDTREGPVRPVIRTFYDHLQPINDLDFHPQSTVLISGAKDHTIKFFDFSKTVAKRAFRVIQDTHNVRSVSFHPSGEFLLAGCRELHQLEGYSAIIEGGSFSAIQWGSGKSSYPWILVDLVEEVQDILSQLGASFLHINWGANDAVDGLAREGVFQLHISFDV